jgi:hypothetical protein
MDTHPNANKDKLELVVDKLELVVDAVKPNGIKCGTCGSSSIEERHLATGE